MTVQQAIKKYKLEPLSVSVAKATKTPLPVLCAVCSAAGPAIEDLMAKENGITVDMSALGRFAKGGGDAQ